VIIEKIVKLYGIELMVELEISNATFVNDGVGWTQYGSHWQFDEGEYYLEDFFIERISLKMPNGSMLDLDENSKLYKRLEVMLIDDSEVIGKVISASVEEAENDRREYLVEMAEYRRESSQNNGLGR